MRRLIPNAERRARLARRHRIRPIDRAPTVEAACADIVGVVEVALLDDVGAAGRAALDAEAARLTAWLGGIRLATVWASPLMKAHATAMPAPKRSRR